MHRVLAVLGSAQHVVLCDQSNFSLAMNIRRWTEAGLSHFVRSIVFCFIAGWPVTAFAFRPFDGTDAAVADLGHVEVELQSFGAAQDGAVKTLTMPQAVFNYGFAQDWEAVLQGTLETPISPAGRESLTGNGLFLKRLFRPGALQDQPGPSLAAEFGLVLPNVDPGPTFVKPSWTWIVSDRFPWGTVHLNFTANLMSDPRTDLFASVIIEGPEKWAVRPVAEFYSDSMIRGPQTYSALAGLIWKVSDDLSFDVALRHAISFEGSETLTENEIRLGATFSFSVDQLHTVLPDILRSPHSLR